MKISTIRNLSSILALICLHQTTQAQNVGIGTATPLEKLHVIGNVRSSTLAGVGSRLVLSDLNGTLVNATGINSPAWLTTGNDNIVGGVNFLGTTNNVNLQFRTNNLNRITITGTGFVGFNGVTAPVSPINFSAGNSGGLWLTQWDHTGTTDAIARFQMTNAANGSRCLMGITNYDGSANVASAVIGISLNTTATGTGGVGVFGSANNQSGNAVQGSLFFSGAYAGWAGYFNADVFCGGIYLGSDRRLKRDIKPINHALDMISRVAPVSYFYNTEEYSGIGLDENRLSYGFIAQDLEQIMPELVKDKLLDLNANSEKNADLNDSRETEMFKVVNYTLLIPILTQAIKEQQVMIEQLQKEVNDLKSQK
jgi:hypothetical protein